MNYGKDNSQKQVLPTVAVFFVFLAAVLLKLGFLNGSTAALALALAILLVFLIIRIYLNFTQGNFRFPLDDGPGPSTENYDEKES